MGSDRIRSAIGNELMMEFMVGCLGYVFLLLHLEYERMNKMIELC